MYYKLMFLSAILLKSVFIIEIRKNTVDIAMPKRKYCDNKGQICSKYTNFIFLSYSIYIQDEVQYS